MAEKKQKVIKSVLIVISSVIAVLYPALVYYFLVIRGISLRHLSLFIIAFALVAFIAATSKKKSLFHGSIILFGVGILCFIINSSVILKFYPLLMNIILLVSFGSTFFLRPNMIFRFALMQDKSIKGSLGEHKVKSYCLKVTIMWCVFFVLNGSVAAWTIFSGSDVIWSVYNGGISYVLVGLLFAVEFIIRKIVQKNNPRAVPLSAFKNNSRRLTDVVCYEGVYSESKFKTWGDFLEGAAKLRRQIEKIDSGKWLLYCDDLWHFLLAFTALLQCKKEILLSANISPAYIAEIRRGAPVLTDQEEHFVKAAETQGSPFENIFCVSKILNAPDSGAEKVPAIIADETSIVMYTSGSTGQPKEVKQRLTEFENDNLFILSKWGEEVLKRKLFSTVSQHHIYGLLYSVLLPFTAGVPFRRTRIDYPEEIERFSDTQYMLITVPSFLKRAVEMKDTVNLRLKSMWIFTSGGVLDPHTAQMTHNVFGFWPLEVYGSTETSGIAWRQSVNGVEWTPFDNVKLSKNQEGCLNIKSPYIKEAEGFQTSDMVELLEDGRFLLKGRLDSVVKIEEKRTSLVEIESRIIQSGFASDVCVIPMEDKRQYLAAAIVFNDKGKERFLGLEKNEINNFWRDYLVRYFDNIVIPKKWRYPDAIPVNLQGKKIKDEIKLLFLNKTTQPGAADLLCGFSSIDDVKVIEKTEKSVTLEFTAKNSSVYFDGHFPNFPILPAVAQLELAARFASQFLGTSISFSEIKRSKFSNFIKPDMPILLKLEKKDNDIVFNFSSIKENVVCSVGTVVQEKI